MFIYLIKTGINLIQGLKNIFLLVMHQRKKDTIILIKKTRKIVKPGIWGVTTWYQSMGMQLPRS